MVKLTELQCYELIYGNLISYVPHYFKRLNNDQQTRSYCGTRIRKELSIFTDFIASQVGGNLPK